MVSVEVLAWDEALTVSGDPEESTLGLVEGTGVDGVHLVVGHESHPVVGDAEEHEGQQGHGQAARGGGGEEQDDEQTRDEQVLGAQADEQGGGCQEQQGEHHTGERLTTGETM